MREIEFRGIREDNKEWVYGDLLHTISITNGVEKHHTLIGVDLSFSEVIPKTVGQWTGTKDINGQKIYEGDVVRVWGGTNHNGMFEYDKTFGIGNMSVRYLDITNAEYVEVVGNIHEEARK